MSICSRRPFDSPASAPIRELWNGRFKSLSGKSRQDAFWNSLDPAGGKETYPKCEATIAPPCRREGFAVVLVDSSVWIEVFRKPDRFRLESVAEIKEVVTCLPIIQEVLQGFRDERDFRLAREAIYALLIIESPLRQEVFDQAVTLFREARRQGLTVRSSVDCLIAACALRHGLTVLHIDRDFTMLARVSPLRAQQITL